MLQTVENGNPLPSFDLPILRFEEEIIESILTNRVTIITAETGAGKSTQVPQFLLNYDFKIVVTEPRRLAARSVAKRVAEEFDCELGADIGYRTAFERCDSQQTRCLFCTDGLELVRELHFASAPDILIIDEVHEWNINIETLVAWSKKQLAENPNFKLVIMSATLEAEKLAAYFGDASIIEVPGQLFPIEERTPTQPDIAAEVAALVQEGRNVLVFQPGKKEIAETIKALKEMNVSAIILPLHGELEPEEQDKVFERYPLPKVVVTTNVAQTSITIDDIDAVVDSGLERRIETIDGIEGLYLRGTAKSDDIQRKGRAGRTRPGIYINCKNSLDDQLDFPKAEIQRVRLDQLVLRLAILGFDATELEFFHQPDKAILIEAKRSLHALGAIDAEEQVTNLGREMARLPISVNFARMIIEAINLDVAEAVLTIAACLEVNGITNNKKEEWRSLTEETSSDLLAQLEIFSEVMNRSWSNEEMRANGILPKSFYRAREIRQKLIYAVIDSARRKNIYVDLKPNRDKEKIIKACVTGMVDHLYQVGFGNTCTNGDDKQRRINKNSVAIRSVGWGSWIVGLPLDIEAEGKWGKILHLVTMVTKVDPQWLAEIAPHLVKTRDEVNFDPELNLIRLKRITIFNGQDLPESEEKYLTWAELIENLPESQSAEQLRAKMIKEQFEMAKQCLILLDDRLLDNDPTQSALDQELSCHRSKKYGVDPATNEDLKAFPGVIVKQGIFGDTFYISNFMSQIEADLATLSAKKRCRCFSLGTEIKKQPHPFERFTHHTPTPSKPKEWRYDGSGFWRCPNGHMLKAGKGAKEIKCKDCNLSHKIN